MKPGPSHAFGAFVSPAIGSVLPTPVLTYAPPPAEAGATVRRHVAAVVGTSFPGDLTGGLVVVVGRSFVRDAAYHLGRHGD